MSTSATRPQLLPADPEWAAALVALWQAEDEFDAAEPEYIDIANKRLTAARLRAEAAGEQVRRRSGMGE